jgi:hypothetical protein
MPGLSTLVRDLSGWLPEVVMHDLRIGAARATIRFWRSDNGRSHAEILKKNGTLRPIPRAARYGHSLKR